MHISRVKKLWNTLTLGRARYYFLLAYFTGWIVPETIYRITSPTILKYLRIRFSHFGWTVPRTISTGTHSATPDYLNPRLLPYWEYPTFNPKPPQVLLWNHELVTSDLYYLLGYVLLVLLVLILMVSYLREQ